MEYSFFEKGEKEKAIYCLIGYWHILFDRNALLIEGGFFYFITVKRLLLRVSCDILKSEKIQVLYFLFFCCDS